LTQKLIFSIEDVKMIQENPNSNFAVLSLDFFASGENLHNMYVSEETLMKTADGIKNCPIVWKYDEKLDDIYTHDKDEVPCGFVPESSIVETKKLSDGRTMLSVVAYVWKRYTGELLSFFKRDGGKKPVSVEMSVFNTRELSNGLTEILDFRYEGITVLGSFVTPAIPLANASVLSFSEIKEEYKKDFKKEFFYNNADMEIPEIVKSNVKQGLELKKKYNVGSTSVAASFAKYLTNEKRITLDKARYIADYFSNYNNKDFQQESNPPSEKYISSLLLGGVTSYKWAQSIVDNINREEKKLLYNQEELITFPYTSSEDINPALKGIKPPVSLVQANKIAKQADSIGSDEKKNGWAIAISSFKKTHTVKDGKWVEKSSERKEMFMEPEYDFSLNSSQILEILNNSLSNYTYGENDFLKYYVMAYNEDMSFVYMYDNENRKNYRAKYVLTGNTASISIESVEEVISAGWLPVKENYSMEEENTKAKETDELEKMATDVSPEKEEMKEKMKEEMKEKKFEFPKNFDMEMMEQMFAEDEDEEVMMAKDEVKKEFCDPSIIMGGMFAKLVKMANSISKMAEENKVYMEENENLKKFRAEIESQQKNFEVDKTLKELAEKVILSAEARDEMVAESEKYSFEHIGEWVTYCKAKSFDFAAKTVASDEIVKVGMPFTATTSKKKDDLWAS